MLNIFFLGKSKFEYNGKPIAQTLGNKAVALICLLILNQNRYLSREKIIGYLWPDSSEDAAKYNLRFNLWQIKKSINTDSQGEPFLRVDKDCCGINSKYEFTCDILEILNFKPSNLDSVESLLKLKELFCGDFLEGSYFSCCDALNELILFERINIENKKVRILKQLASMYEENCSYDAAIEVINEIHEIEPYDEEMALKIMGLFLSKGNRAGAIAYYSSFSSRLTGGLGISPSGELKELYSKIRNQEQEKEASGKISRVVMKEQPKEKSVSAEVTIHTFCIEGVEYFWMAEVLSQLLKKIKMSALHGLDRECVLDLSYIQIEMLRCMEGKSENRRINEIIPQVRIITGFIRCLEVIGESYKICIKIGNSQEMDGISKKVFQHLKRVKMEGISLQID